MGLTRGAGRLGAWAGDLRKWSHPGMQVKRWLGLLLRGAHLRRPGDRLRAGAALPHAALPGVGLLLHPAADRPRLEGGAVPRRGVGAVVAAIVQLNRSLMTAVQPPYVSDGGRLVDVVYNYRLPQRRPQVVAFAGHRGFLALQGQRELYAKKLLGVASVADGPLPADLQDAQRGPRRAPALSGGRAPGAVRRAGARHPPARGRGDPGPAQRRPDQAHLPRPRGRGRRGRPARARRASSVTSTCRCGRRRCTPSARRT